MPGVTWRRSSLFFIAAVIAATISPAWSAEQKSSESGKAGGREGCRRRIDEIAEASRAMTGPAAQAECVWLGQRAVGLMWRDDLDTAFRHLDLYDRFGCPGEHVQMSFRCVVRQGNIDPKATETFNARVHSCWINPTMMPATAAAAAPVEKPGTK